MLLAVLSLAAMTSTLPEYKSELLARTNGGSTYNLPAYAMVNSTSPSINDAGEVAFIAVSGGMDQNGDHSEQAAVWLKTRNDQDGRIVYYAPKEKMVSDPKMLDRGDVLFSQFDEVTSDGIFSFNSQKQVTENIFPAKNMAAVNYPQATSDASYVFRSTDSENNRSFFEFRSDKLSEIINEDGGYSYLFGPSVNAASQWIFKARVGEKFNYAEEAPDQIVLLTPHFTAFGEKSYQKTVLAQDSDSDPLSPYKSFDNSPAITNAGLVVFTAMLKDRVRMIVAVKDGVHHEVAREGQNDISQIEMFSPQINDNGFVVFRAKNSKGLRGIYLANPFATPTAEVKRLLGEGDSILTDQGMGAILRKNDFPGFGGNVDINNNNEIVVSTVVATENQKWIFGTAIYKLHPL